MIMAKDLLEKSLGHSAVFEKMPVQGVNLD
jgi:hypothetical protein